MIRRTMVAFLVTALALGAIPALAAEPGWLLGRWELTHDPQSDAKDWLEFHPDGRAVSIAPSGRRIPGEYTLAEGEVRIVYSLAGRQIPITLKVSPDRTRLFAHSARTGTASTYERVK
jgi:hypothetical protein